MFPVLKDFRHRRAGTLSGGERRMLAIGMGLMKNTKVMLLDEITTTWLRYCSRRSSKKSSS